jgi:hypothetical protein
LFCLPKKQKYNYRETVSKHCTLHFVYSQALPQLVHEESIFGTMFSIRTDTTFQQFADTIFLQHSCAISDHLIITSLFDIFFFLLLHCVCCYDYRFYSNSCTTHTL